MTYCSHPLFVFLSVINTAAQVLSAAGFILVGAGVLIAVLRPAAPEEGADE